MVRPSPTWAARSPTTWVKNTAEPVRNVPSAVANSSDCVASRRESGVGGTRRRNERPRPGTVPMGPGTTPCSHPNIEPDESSVEPVETPAARSSPGLVTGAQRPPSTSGGRRSSRSRPRRSSLRPMRAFSQVDVFSSEPLKGNPVAVVHDAEGIDEEEMRRFAQWTNLSETTFLLPSTTPEADYRLRIFTPSEELPFAGHPTIGSAHAWLEAGGEPRDADEIVQESGAGLVRVRRAERLAFAAPPLLREGPVTDQERAQ